MLSATIDPCPSAETEIDSNWRTAFDLTYASDIRLQAQVLTPCVGARLSLKASADNGATWGNVSAGGTGPWVDVGIAGDQRGTSLNVNPIYRGDVLLSVFVSGGDNATALELGNVGALLYVMTTEGGIVEISEVVLCAVPDVALSDDFSSYADDDAFQTFIWNQPSGAPLLLNWYIEAVLDFLVTFSGNPTLYLASAGTSYNETYFDDLAPEPTDVTLLTRFKLDPMTFYTTAAYSGYALVQFTARSNNRMYLCVRDTDRVVFSYRATLSPITYINVDIGPVSDVTDQDLELIARCWEIDANYIGVRFYLQPTCGEPVLYYENLQVPRYVAASSGIYYLGRFLPVATQTSVSFGALRIYQEAITYDPTDFGIPA